MPGGGKGGGGKGTIGANVGIDAHVNAIVDATTTSNANMTSDNKIDTKATALLQLVGLDNIRLTADTDSKAQIDVKPLQADLCLKVGIERLPSTRITQPSARHLGFSLFGVEVFGVDYVSRKKTLIEDLGSAPFVVAGQSGGHFHDDCHDEDCPDGVRMSVGK